VTPTVQPAAIGFRSVDRPRRDVSGVFRLEGVISMQCADSSISALETKTTHDDRQQQCFLSQLLFRRGQSCTTNSPDTTA